MDIPVPPPREAKVWYCLKCGNAGAAPEPGIHTIDHRYAIGYCECTKGRQNRVSGFKREKVNLVADFAFNRYEWEERQLHKKQKAAYERQRGGMALSSEESRLATAYRIRMGLPAK